MSPRQCKTVTKASASLLFNNLASNGKFVAYVHDKEAILLPESAVVSGSASPSLLRLPVGQDPVKVQQARWVSPPDVPVELLVIATTRSLQVYSSDGKRLIHTIPLVRPSEDMVCTFRGIAACMAGMSSYLFVGSSMGELSRVPVVDAAPTMGKYATLKVQRPWSHDCPISNAHAPGTRHARPYPPSVLGSFWGLVLHLSFVGLVLGALEGKN